MPGAKIDTVVDGPDLDDVRRLFVEYSEWLGIDLSFQQFERELDELPGDYAGPHGTLLLCRSGSAAVGCIAMRRWACDTAEMKRLFVREASQGSGCGVLLAEQAIGWARRTGYRRVLLDTLPVMARAQHLYARLGFRDVPPYRFNPIAGARFMELLLEPQEPA